MIASRRNSNARPMEMPMYDSMAQMASATGIPLSVLKEAKRMGCGFVRHGRCDLLEFVKWDWARRVAGDDADDKIWSNELNRVRTEREKIRLQIDKLEVIERNLVIRLAQDLVGSLIGELEKLAQYFPSKLKGMTETQIFPVVTKEIGRIKTILLAKWTNWKQSYGGDDLKP